MEQTFMSSPLGHSEWESEHKLSHGFLLSSEKGPVLPQKQNSQTGLDFQRDDQNISLSLEEIFHENALNLDSLFRGSSYTGEPILQREAEQSNHFEGDHKITTQGILALTDKTEGQGGSSDGCFSDPFSLSNTTDWLGDNFPGEEAPRNDPESASSLDQLTTILDCPSPQKVPDRTLDTNTESLLVDLLSEPCPSPLPVEADPQGVSRELLLPSLDDDRGLPPSLGGEIVSSLSPETGNKGLFQEPVTDLVTVGNTSPEGLPESCLSHDADPANGHREPREALEGPLPLLDSAVPEGDHSLSLCPVSLTSLTSTGAPSDSHAENPEQEPTLASPVLTVSSGHLGEGDSPQSSVLLTKSAPRGSLSDGDALGLADLPRDSSPEHACQDLMDNFLCNVKHEEDEEMALDHSLNADELHDKEMVDLKILKGVQEGNVYASQTEQDDRDRSTGSDQVRHQDCHKTDAFGFPDQELTELSPEAGWTSEQTLETHSLSEMVVSDSMAGVPIMNQREEDQSPLKAVFDALDQDGDGFVRIEEFLEFAAAYGADQVKDLTKFLDPSGLGVISFEDFHRGVSAISSGGPEPHLYDVHFSPGDSAGGCQEEYDEQNEVTDSAYLGSESTYSECETFTDEDTGALVAPEMHEDVETDSGIEAALHDQDDGSNRFSLNSELHDHSLVTVIGGEEEHFEDFGESNTSELLETNEGSEGEGEGVPSLLQTPDQVDCSSLLLSPSTGKRLSSKKVARHLLHNSSMTLDSMGELSRDILDLADSDITDKVLLLERRVAELEQDSEASGEQHTRLRQENLQLVHRTNALEEQLKELELRAEEQLHQEARRHKDALGKLERERGLELENLQARLQQLDEENSELRSCVPCLRANIERLEEEKRKLQDEVEDVMERLNEELDSRRKMADRLSHERHQNQKEKECTQELIEDLRKQLEHLQLYKLEAEARRGRSPSAGLQEYQSRTREAELEQEVRRLKQDNRSLKDQNDELNGQIINLSIQGAKNLVTASFSESLAAEINSVSRGELMEAIHKQEEINYRLQDYIDRIIVAIMESNPSILEVK
ncbi:rab11 family-interacting protein 3 isoform X1 [Hypomesus transpacificus]|uniref:rab11 family-interacting protein 3 isoform X1 n=1 Tax=Hypomesus transpacificus TaxID=137520 RepID=UPI001F08779C|nr:rab11 family-interacting protein 3 isoform X1 [Hypomesus transpacificus]